MHRSATHSGSWYDNDKDTLKQTLDEYLYNAINNQPLTDEFIKIIIVPHAGYVYSGQTAAYAFSRLLDPHKTNINQRDFKVKDSIKRIILLGPLHRYSILDHSKLAAYSSVDKFETPFCTLEMDRDTVEILKSNYSDCITNMPIEDDEEEHSLEMQFPFLARICPLIPIVPIYIGGLSTNQIHILSDCLDRWFMDRETVFIVSSDFCHWGARFSYKPMPAIDIHFPTAAHVNEYIDNLDSKAKQILEDEKVSVNSWIEYLDRTRNTICGRYPLSVLVGLVQKARIKNSNWCVFKFNHYSYSNKINNIRSDSRVSYVSGYGVIA